jgi:predicted O-methyltransferase YrrM
MDFLPKEISVYSESHTSPEGELLSQIDRDTHLHVNMPRMLSGHLQGRLLSFLSKMARPERILEIGTYTGYSALCMAEGLVENGLLYTLDINEELEKRVRGYFARSPYADQIKYLVGDAMELLPALDENFDLVFIDADKANYLNYYRLVVDKVRSGGWIIADNVLWSGKVVDKSKKDKDTEALRVFNEAVHLDQKVENLLLPIRDGLMVLRKK